MTLETLPPKPQIFIRFSSNIFHSFYTGENTALYFLKKELSEKMPEYRFDVIAGADQQQDWTLNIVNAHLNYEAVAYINNKIVYPYVTQNIHELIRKIYTSILESTSLATAAQLEEVSQSQHRFQQFESAENIVEELNSHMKNRKSNFIFKLNYSDIPEILLISNNSGNLMMHASHETALQILKKAGSLADEITANAARQGINFALKCGQPKLNQFASVILPDFNKHSLKSDRNSIILVQELIGCLRDIDLYGQISEHGETVWRIYLYSYKAAAINKIKEIAYEIKTD